MLLVVRFLNDHEIYCIEACENFIIHYANIRQNKEKKISLLSLVGFHLSIKYSYKKLLILLQHELESSNQ